MKALLIYPQFPNTFWSFSYALKFISKKAAFPPLGLLTVAAMLPADWNLRLVDLNTRPLTEDDLAWAEWAFISGMGVQKQSAREAIARCRQAGLKTVAGGPLFTTEWEDFPEVDHFVLNEAELTLPPFLADLAAGNPGRLYRSGEFADIRRTPPPRWDLADLRSYASLSVQYSRGCPYQCDFCNVTALFGNRHRTKSAAQIIAELDLVYARGWRQDIFFVDDNFIGNRHRLKTELLPALIAWRQANGSGITFATEVSINLADDADLMRLLATAGFTTVFVGIETPEDSSLNECSKKQNRNRNLIEDVRSLQRSGLQVQGGFIVGFDSDPPSIFQRQVDFIQQSGIVMAMVGMLQAPPGTRLYERLRREGRLQGELSGDNVDGTTNIIPAMGLDILREGYKSVLRTIYAPENYYQRVKVFLREYRPAVGKKTHTHHKLAFLRSLYRLGIFGRERREYWRLLLWTALHRPRLFPLAVTLAIYGHHFRKICEMRVL